jgi:hypothetical protein
MFPLNFIHLEADSRFYVLDAMANHLRTPARRVPRPNRPPRLPMLDSGISDDPAPAAPPVATRAAFLARVELGLAPHRLCPEQLGPPPLAAAGARGRRFRLPPPTLMERVSVELFRCARVIAAAPGLDLCDVAHESDNPETLTGSIYSLCKMAGGLDSTSPTVQSEPGAQGGLAPTALLLASGAWHALVGLFVRSVLPVAARRAPGDPAEAPYPLPGQTVDILALAVLPLLRTSAAASPPLAMELVAHPDVASALGLLLANPHLSHLASLTLAEMASRSDRDAALARLPQLPARLARLTPRQLLFAAYLLSSANRESDVLCNTHAAIVAHSCGAPTTRAVLPPLSPPLPGPCLRPFADSAVRAAATALPAVLSNHSLLADAVVSLPLAAIRAHGLRVVGQQHSASPAADNYAIRTVHLADLLAARLSLLLEFQVYASRTPATSNAYVMTLLERMPALHANGDWVSLLRAIDALSEARASYVSLKRSVGDTKAAEGDNMLALALDRFRTCSTALAVRTCEISGDGASLCVAITSLLGGPCRDVWHAAFLRAGFLSTAARCLTFLDFGWVDPDAACIHGPGCVCGTAASFHAQLLRMLYFMFDRLGVHRPEPSLAFSRAELRCLGADIPAHYETLGACPRHAASLLPQARHGLHALLAHWVRALDNANPRRQWALLVLNMLMRSGTERDQLFVARELGMLDLALGSLLLDRPSAAGPPRLDLQSAFDLLGTMLFRSEAVFRLLVAATDADKTAQLTALTFEHLPESAVFVRAVLLSAHAFGAAADARGIPPPPHDPFRPLRSPPLPPCAAAAALYDPASCPLCSALTDHLPDLLAAFWTAAPLEELRQDTICAVNTALMAVVLCRSSGVRRHLVETASAIAAVAPAPGGFWQRLRDGRVDAADPVLPRLVMVLAGVRSTCVFWRDLYQADRSRDLANLQLSTAVPFAAYRRANRWVFAEAGRLLRLLTPTGRPLPEARPPAADITRLAVVAAGDPVLIRQYVPAPLRHR